MVARTAAPAHELLGQRVLELDRRLGQRDEARQRVAVELGELGRADPLDEGLGGLLVRARGIDAHADIDMVGDVALVAGVLHRRLEGAHLERGVLAERRDLPAAGRVDRGAAEREQVLAVGVGLGLEAVAEIGLPARDHLERLDIGGVGQLGASHRAAPCGPPRPSSRPGRCWCSPWSPPPTGRRCPSPCGM